MAVAKVAQAIALIFERPCNNSTLFEWVQDLGSIYAAKAPWSRHWLRRARALRVDHGTSLDNIASIITIEARRRCHRNTVSGWLGLKRKRQPTC